MFQKYNSFFDLKTKQILKFFHFSFFNFITKTEKGKNFLKLIFWFQIKNEFKNFDFRFLKLVWNQNRFKKNFFCFSFFNSIMKFEKWKIFFEIRFFISNQKTNYEILDFVFRFSFWNGLHQNLFWEVGSKNRTKITLTLNEII